MQLLQELKAKAVRLYLQAASTANVVSETVGNVIKVVKLSLDVATLEQRKAELESLFSDVKVTEIDLSDIPEGDIATFIAEQIKKDIEQVKQEVEK